MTRFSSPVTRGFTLIELCLVTAIGALLLTALTHVVGLATQSKAQLSQTTEYAAQAELVMQRLRAAARAATVSPLLANTSDDTGLWLAPKRFCINTARALIETSVTDTGCGGSEVIAERVSRLTLSAAEGQSAVDAPMVLLTVVLTQADGTDGPPMTQSIRLKGLQE